jgi:hypothetical protein
MGHMGLARLLIEHGAETAAQAKDGVTTPHRASRKRARRACTAPHQVRR